MKKLRIIFFAIILSGLIFLSACGTNGNDPDTEQQDEPEQEDVAEKEATEDESVEDEKVVEEDTTEEIGEEIVAENEAFKVFEPAPNSIVDNEITVRGEARVFEATVSYEFEDGHNILDEGTVTASQGAPDWGEFEIKISFDEVANDTGMIVLFEESAKDGSRQNELIIPVKVEN